MKSLNVYFAITMHEIYPSLKLLLLLARKLHSLVRKNMCGHKFPCTQRSLRKPVMLNIQSLALSEEDCLLQTTTLSIGGPKPMYTISDFKLYYIALVIIKNCIVFVQKHTF